MPVPAIRGVTWVEADVQPGLLKVKVSGSFRGTAIVQGVVQLIPFDAFTTAPSGTELSATS